MSHRTRPALLCAALLMLGACARAPSAAVRPDPPALRVMTYNIFAGNDLERRSNLERIAALADSLAVDVVFLQEVDRNTGRSGRVDQAATLASLTGMHHVFGRSMDYGGGEYGNAILSRWPVQTSRVLPLQDSVRAAGAAQENEPRSLLYVVIAAPGGVVHLINTHLDHRAESPSRNAQLLELLAFVADSVPRAAPTVLAGDFNARPDTPLMRALRLSFTDAWTACGAGDGYTFRSDRPDRRIDYVLLAGVQCSRAWVLDTQLSDHLPVVVDLRLSR